MCHAGIDVQRPQNLQRLLKMRKLPLYAALDIVHLRGKVRIDPFDL